LLGRSYARCLWSETPVISRSFIDKEGKICGFRFLEIKIDSDLFELSATSQSDAHLDILEMSVYSKSVEDSASFL